MIDRSGHVTRNIHLFNLCVRVIGEIDRQKGRKECEKKGVWEGRNVGMILGAEKPWMESETQNSNVNGIKNTGTA